MNAEGEACAGNGMECEETAYFLCQRCRMWFCGKCLGSDTSNSPFVRDTVWTLECDLCDECSGLLYSAINEAMKS